VRAAGVVLNAMLGISAFRVLTGFERVKVPAAPNRWMGKPVVRKDSDRVFLEFTVNLLSATMDPVRSGTVIVEIDLENAAPAIGHLLYHFTPADDIKEVFGEYRDMISGAITATLQRLLGDQLSQISYEIVLNEVDTSTLELLRDALSTIVAVDATPQVFRVHEAVRSEPIGGNLPIVEAQAVAEVTTPVVAEEPVVAPVVEVEALDAVFGA
jgi:hypothetical protein